MSSASQYLDHLLGGSQQAAGESTQKSDLDSLFGGRTASAYLDSLLLGGDDTGGAIKQPARPTDPNNPESDAYRAKYGSYGGVKDIGSVDLTNADSVAEMAKRGGWADPKAFNLDMLDRATPIMRGGSNSGGGTQVGTPIRFKPEFAAARAMGDGYNTPNQVDYFDRVVETGTGHWDNPDTVRQTGYKVKAGYVKDAGKRGADIYYEYDDKGNFKVANFDVRTSTFEQIAPLVSMAGMAVGLGGLGAGLGASANSALGLGLGSTGQAALGGAIIGGGTSALTGQNPVKGAALGAIGGGISAANPAANIVQNPVAQRAINGAISGGVRSALTGGKVSDNMISGGINGAFSAIGNRNRTT